MSLTYVALAVAALVAAWAGATFNLLVRLRNKVDEAWSGIDVQLRRRHDLVPNLTAAVHAYADHERSILAVLAAARTAASAARGPADAAPAESTLTGALSAALRLAESYPELLAAANFARLQNELTEVENEIEAARRIFNANVVAFNGAVQTLPSALIARPARFTAREFFTLEPATMGRTPAVDLR